MTRGDHQLRRYYCASQRRPHHGALCLFMVEAHAEPSKGGDDGVLKHAERVNILQPVASWSRLTGSLLSMWLHRL